MSNIRPMDKAKIVIDQGEFLYKFEPERLELSSGVGQYGYHFQGYAYSMIVEKKEDPMACVNPELTLDDLYTIGKALAYLEDIAEIQGMHAVEIRMKTEDPTYWTVLGYGESGDPCVIRFEKD